MAQPVCTNDIQWPEHTTLYCGGCPVETDFDNAIRLKAVSILALYDAIDAHYCGMYDTRN